jgi:hypothetical protein
VVPHTVGLATGAARIYHIRVPDFILDSKMVLSMDVPSRMVL